MLSRLSHLSLVARIAIMSVAVGLVFAVATTAIGYSKASAGLNEQGEARLQSDAVVVTRAVDSWTNEHLELARALGTLPTVSRFLEAGEAASPQDSEFLNSLGVSLKDGVTDVTGFTITDAKGISLVTQGGSLGQSHANRDYFQNAIKAMTSFQAYRRSSRIARRRSLWPRRSRPPTVASSAFRRLAATRRVCSGFWTPSTSAPVRRVARC